MLAYNLLIQSALNASRLLPRSVTVVPKYLYFVAVECVVLTALTQVVSS
jgi:hypothetical protein